jgi:hypothetical protein
MQSNEPRTRPQGTASGCSQRVPQPRTRRLSRTRRFARYVPAKRGNDAGTTAPHHSLLSLLTDVSVNPRGDQETTKSPTENCRRSRCRCHSNRNDHLSGSGSVQFPALARPPYITPTTRKRELDLRSIPSGRPTLEETGDQQRGRGTEFFHDEINPLIEVFPECAESLGWRFLGLQSQCLKLDLLV